MLARDLVVRKNSVKKGREIYAGYRILNRDFDRRNLDAVIKILSWSSIAMRTPKMMHFALEIEDYDIFETNGFIQKFKEKFNSYIRERNRQRNKTTSDKRTKLPEIQVIYSVEAKMLGDYCYNHLHLMVIIDTNHNDYGRNELAIAINRALSSINGLESLYFDSSRGTFFKDADKKDSGFLKYRNENSSVKIGTFKQLCWHDLKTELPDAVCRASYMCKLDQKDLLPEKFKRGNSFGHTRPKTIPSKNRSKIQSNIEIGTQLNTL